MRRIKSAPGDMARWVINWFKRDKKIMLGSLLAGALFTCAAGAATSAYSNAVQADIAGQVIRFHVRANSDGEADQFLKLAVKDRILSEFEEELESSDSLEETREVLFLNMENIEAAARDEVRRRGYDYPVRARMATAFFPTKRYADFTLPAGEYEALELEIGQASGQNWWCVMYPPLCFVDVTQAKAPEKTREQFRRALSEEEYTLVTLGSEENAPTAKNTDVKIKFKIVEWWQERKAKSAGYIAAKT